MLKAISHVTMLVNDQDATVNFYKKLGFIIHTDANFGDMRWLTLCLEERRDFELVILQATSDAEKALVGKQAGNHPFITLESTDCFKDYETLQAQEIAIVDKPEKQPWGTAMSIKDNSGNIVYICQHA
ncbi:MAG TPA: VOC family protein [Candidatus Babeliales bacterium]|nr:VOC family protein [Candidatus Babeliales bacterium]